MYHSYVPQVRMAYNVYESVPGYTHARTTYARNWK